ncbi:MAG TPA: hypothetical protein VEY08_14235 [Chloroflexia bacterium]|nr:hypothetical protein [Chloroflexia bacterium]
MSKRVLRGTPIYATRRGERIALVPEVRLSSKRLLRRSSGQGGVTLEPAALYVIDRSGVKKVALESPTARGLGLLALSCLLAPALNWLSRRGSTHG